MQDMSRRRFLKWTAITGGTLVFGGLASRGRLMDVGIRMAHADEPIKIGILDPLSSPYKTSSIHDVHGANVAVDLFNKKGGVLGRPVAILEADDASNPDQAVKAATKFIKEDRVDALMGTFNGECALAVSALAGKEDKLFMVTLDAHLLGDAAGRKVFDPTTPTVISSSAAGEQGQRQGCRRAPELSSAIALFGVWHCPGSPRVHADHLQPLTTSGSGRRRVSTAPTATATARRAAPRRRSRS